MARILLLPGYGLVKETTNGTLLLPGFGLIKEAGGVTGSVGAAVGADTTVGHAGSLAVATGTGVAAAQTGNVGIGSATGTGVADAHRGSLAVATGTSSAPADALVGPTVVVDSATRYQTMEGWETTCETWINNKTTLAYDTSWFTQDDEILRRLVYEMGITRVQVPIRSGWQNTADYYAQFKAGTIDYTALGSHWYETMAGEPTWFTEFDDYCDNVMWPLVRHARERGETMIVALNFIDFGTSGDLDFSQNATLYAAYVKQFYDRIIARYGITPEAIDIILEPDNMAQWNNGTRIANCLVALKAAIPAARMIAPSPTNAFNTTSLCGTMDNVSGCLAAWDMVGYHRYGGGNTDAANIKTYADANGLKTGMTEWFNATIDTVLDDLTIGGVSLWQKWGLAGKIGVGSNPQAWYYIYDAGVPSVNIATNSHHMALLFPFVRNGADRIDAVSAEMSKIVAFENANGSQVVFMKRTTAGGVVNFSGLQPGSYGVRHIPNASTTAQNNADITVGGGGTAAITIPTGYTVIYKRDAQAWSANEADVDGVSGSTGVATGANATAGHRGSTAQATGTGTAQAYSGVDAIGTATGAGVAAAHAGSTGQAVGDGAAAGHRGSVGEATGTGTAQGLSGAASVAAAVGGSIAAAHAGSEAHATGAGATDVRSGSVAASVGTSVASGVGGEAGGAVGAAVGAGVAAGHAGSTGQATGSGTAVALSQFVSIASAVGGAIVVAHAGSTGAASGASTSIALRGSGAVADGFSVALARAGYSAEAAGAGVAAGHAGYVAQAIGGAEVYGIGPAPDNYFFNPRWTVVGRARNHGVGRRRNHEVKR